MKRKIYAKLSKWKDNLVNKKPLMVLGAGKIGKTYAIREFCKENYQNVVEIDLTKRKDIVELYKMPKDSEFKFMSLKTLLNFDIEKENTVLFIDEIQESEGLIMDLKYFCEEKNNIDVICTGSLLNVRIKNKDFSFPHGKVTKLEMRAMDFEEFMWALNENILLDEIKKAYKTNTPLVEPVHQKALDLYRLYTITGGMPESVLNFVNTKKDIIKYDKDILKNIKESYFDSMNKFIQKPSWALRIRRLFNSVPLQIENESKKFQYSKVTQKARAREYEEALCWLIESGMVMQSYCITNPSVPPELYKMNDAFRLYINDIGLLNNILDIKYSNIITDNLSENKNVITKNYLAEQLVINDHKLYYWTSDYTAEVDFIIYTDDGLIPIELVTGVASKSNRLKIYIEKFKPNYALRVGTHNFGFDKELKVKTVPLYAVFCIK